MSFLIPRFKNSFKLFTHEDTFQSHKLVGFISLSHFLYRIYRWAIHGPMGMITKNERFLFFWVFVHTYLSMSSLFFPLPKNRPTTLPVIWPEYRLHSIVFALRSILIMGISMCGFPLDVYLTRLVIVFGTMIVADLITSHFKSPHKTMRGMPYPKEWSPRLCKNINLYYSISQVFATSRMIWVNPAGVNALSEPFLILFPIQLAAFLMTLVKKSILTSGAWHVFYGISLGLNYLYCLTLPVEYKSNYPVLSSVLVFCYLRFQFGISKYLLWFMLSIFAHVIKGKII